MGALFITNQRVISMMHLNRLAIALAAACSLSAAALTAAAASDSSGSTILADDVSGGEHFQRYCALCHGADGRGAGPVTDKMTRPAPDLTQIAKRNNGHFPFSMVAAKILEGGGVAEHAASSMPAWGKIFAAESDPIRAKATIFEVTTFLETLQEK